MAPVKRQKSAKAGGSKSKRRKDAEAAGLEADEFYDGSDKEVEEENVETVEETAEEKKIRLAKEYLRQMRQTGVKLDVGDEDSGSEADDIELDDDEIDNRLRNEALESRGSLQRNIATLLKNINTEPSETYSGKHNFYKCHRDAVTGLAITSDDSSVYSVGKEGSIIKLDVESGKKSVFYKPSKDSPLLKKSSYTRPEWIQKKSRHQGSNSFLCVSISSDDHYLAVGGTDSRIHVWDLRSNTHIQTHTEHKESVSGLAFRLNSTDLYSCSYDRSVKIFSIETSACTEHLYGHQSEIFSIDALRRERIVTAGFDRTCRVWKVPEETHLVYRSKGNATDCCRYITGNEWVSGSSDGSLCLWSQLRKKPAFVVDSAHDSGSPVAAAAELTQDERKSIQSVAVCRGTDLLASGAADGYVRLWHYEREGPSRRLLSPIGSIPCQGFVNCLGFAHSGRFVVAGVGNEPRLGRWARSKKAPCGLGVYMLDYEKSE